MINAFPPDRNPIKPFCVGVFAKVSGKRRRAVSNADRSNPADKDLAIKLDRGSLIK